MNVECPLCSRIASAPSTAQAVVIADAFPVSLGHCLIVPRRHVARLAELASDEASELFNLVQPTISDVEAKTGAAGFTVGINDGPTAGQMVPHVHLHIIPRYPGDVPDPRGGVKDAIWAARSLVGGDHVARRQMIRKLGLQKSRNTEVCVDRLASLFNDSTNSYKFLLFQTIFTRRVLEAVLWILNTGAQCYPNYKRWHNVGSGPADSGSFD